MIVVLTAVVKIYPQSNITPTVEFLREIVYALERARDEAWSTDLDTIQVEAYRKPIIVCDTIPRNTTISFSPS